LFFRFRYYNITVSKMQELFANLFLLVFFIKKVNLFSSKGIKISSFLFKNIFTINA